MDVCVCERVAHMRFVCSCWEQIKVRSMGEKRNTDVLCCLFNTNDVPWLPLNCYLSVCWFIVWHPYTGCYVWTDFVDILDFQPIFW